MRIKQIRESKDMSQAELSRRSHVHRISISRYETGKSKPNLRTIQKLARVLGVTVDDLLDE